MSDYPEGHPEYTEWVHCLNPGDFDPFAGGRHIMGWKDDRSETGMLSGVVVEVDHLHLRVKVKDIRAGILK